ncbi:hypothetical protein BS50DRAFT_576056 [Corynespora cassiicola Philippines]|uniref:Uncharacterized protein n=1 Tax=Corynespora cassiicola Philippines TaxID=1448308 RepID=A0A2T2NGS2_CORCC|nr:hypothetical protein BS50DRAFT_576056 [Corynespora cassiicola Philippines]
MATYTKVMSLGTSSGAPSPPYQTPRTEALDSVDLPPIPDIAAIGHILEPIQERLNDSADDAKYPSPPINSPAFSPAPSVVFRQGVRSRGLSSVADRLALLRFGDRVVPIGEPDKFTPRSRAPSTSGSNLDGEDGYIDAANEFASTRSGVASTAMDIRNAPIPIALGSHKPNPRIAEYMAHAENSETAEDEKKSSAQDTSKPGVAEKSNWSEDLEDQLERVLLRLEQLSSDEHAEDPSRSVEDYYLARLNRLLGDAKKRAVPARATELPS